MLLQRRGPIPLQIGTSDRVDAVGSPVPSVQAPRHRVASGVVVLYPNAIWGETMLLAHEAPLDERREHLRASRRRHTLRDALVLTLAAALAAPASAMAEDDGGVHEAPAVSAWKWSPSVLFYVLPDEADYVQPTLTADRGALHLEGRYNYEARNTGSAWVGWNLSFGEELKLGLTPMVGSVFGQTKGVAPGLTLTLGWGPLALWSQSEYVFDLGDFSASYFYAWSELTGSIGDWLRVGVALQRTRFIHTSTEVVAGPLVGVSIWKLAATVYLFGPGQDSQYVVVAVAGNF